MGAFPGRAWLVAAALVGAERKGSMRFETRVVAGLTAALVIALAGAQATSAGTLPAGLYPAKAPTPGRGARLLVPAGVGSSNAAASPHGLDCYPVQGFKSVANDRYVTAQLDYGHPFSRPNLYAMLRAAHATAVGPWEKFQFCHVPERAAVTYSIFSDANKKWVATEIGYSGRDRDMLRARSSTVGAWEEYRILCIIGQPGYFMIISDAARRYVAAELGYSRHDYGMLRARSTTAGAWEKFFPFPGCE